MRGRGWPGVTRSRLRVARACLSSWTVPPASARYQKGCGRWKVPPGASPPACAYLAEAGANEAILVVSPINERSIRLFGEAVAALGD